MSAPDTDLQKQERWHKGPLIGMAAGIVFAGVVIAFLAGWIGQNPRDNNLQIDAPAATMEAPAGN